MTTDPQDRIVKQLGDRYVMTRCDQLPDGSLKITASRLGSGRIAYRRTVLVAPGGTILTDTGEQEHDDYSDFAD